MSGQGYTLTLPVNKTVGGSYTDTGNFYCKLVLLKSEYNSMKQKVPECRVRYSNWNCCLFSICTPKSQCYFMLCSLCYKCIDQKRQGTHWMWLAMWMGIGRDRSWSRCVWRMAQHVSPLTSVERKQTGTWCSSYWIRELSCHGTLREV